jgi:hypothetical protein
MDHGASAAATILVVGERVIGGDTVTDVLRYHGYERSSRLGIQGEM